MEDQHNLIATLIDDCAGGTYLMTRTDGTRVGIFKPRQEEPGMDKNPKGVTKIESLEKEGFTSGGGWIREIAAYEIGGEFAGVPKTEKMVFNEEEGSYQEFIKSEGRSDDYPPRTYDPKCVRRIALLDLVILNCDRHSGNMLVVDKKGLIPIDHGLCFPSSLESLDFSWHFWPQSKDKFDDEEKKWVNGLLCGVERVKQLQDWGIDKPSAELSAAATTVLKAYVDQGWTARQLADMWVPARFNEPSALAQLNESCKTDGKIDFQLLEERMNMKE